jgi:hypothetical protein
MKRSRVIPGAVLTGLLLMAIAVPAVLASASRQVALGPGKAYPGGTF